MANATAARQALAVLTLLATHAEPMPAVAIARALGIPRSSTYHLLRVLGDAGFVSHLADDQRWGLGVAAFELGSAYSRQAPLQRIARPLLIRLVDATTHSAHLGVLHGRDVLYVIEERAAGRPSLVTDVGVRLPAVVTASGMAMLAALPRQQVRTLFSSRDDFEQRRGHGPASLSALRSEIAQVRQRGYAFEHDSVTPGFDSVASAVLDHNDQPVAGVAVTYPGPEVGERERDRIVARVRSTADELGRRLGHRSAPVGGPPQQAHSKE